MKEQELLQTVIEKQSWEDVLYHVVGLEGLNPWDIDITKLTSSFLEYVEKMKTLDFRIPGKVILVATVLLKLKAESLYPKENIGEDFGIEDEEMKGEFQLLKERLQEIQLKQPIERFPKRVITLEELVSALRKAVKVKERREKRKRRLGKRLRKEIDIDEIDIEQRISELMGEIDSLLLKLKSEKIGFSKIVDRWERDEIVRHFMPLLYLSSRGDVSVEQEGFFKEIYISVKKVSIQNSK